MGKKQNIPLFIAFGFVLLFLSTQISSNKTETNLATPSSTISKQESDFHFVRRVIDGDTVELSDGTHVRLIGIDTPESGDCYSDQSTNTLKELVEGKNVKLEMDVQEKDKYGRTLAYLYLENTFLNEKMLEDGAAKLLTIPPDVKYANVFIEAQNKARNNKLGLWADNLCNSTLNIEREIQSSISNNGCKIKGNISVSGEKIYHSPGQRYYEKTKIEPEKGEVWFCSVNEAESSAWRKSKV